MKRALALLLTVIIALTSAPLSFAESGSVAAPETGNFVKNEVLITLKKDETISLPLIKSEVLDTSSLDDEHKIIKGTVKYGTDIEEYCRQLEKRSEVISAEPNYIQSAYSVEIPSEAVGTGDEYNAFNWYRDCLGLCEAWQSADSLGSEDVVVAVIDTGVNTSHKELEGALWEDAEGHNGYNAYNGNYDVTDLDGHGSNVAGIITMRANDFGFVGIAPNVKLMPLKAASGSASFTDSNILKCLNFAIENGADVINMSFGGQSLSKTMATAYQRAAGKSVLIAAAGNDGLSATAAPHYPAACNGVIGVMSYGSYKNKDLTNYTNDNGELSGFSNYDESGIYYQLAAPGVNIAGISNKNNSSFTYLSGTSQASPIVAGTAALYLSTHPGATPYQVRNALIEGSNRKAGGYYDDNEYRLLNMSAVLQNEPCEDSVLNLSADALSLLNDCLETDYTEAYLSQAEALSVISKEKISKYADNLQILKELNFVQILDLSSLSLKNEDLSFLEEASFPRLYSLNIRSNRELSELKFSKNTAPELCEIFADGCAFENGDSFKNLPLLYTLTLSENRFSSSEQLRSLDYISELVLSSNALGDVAAFKDFKSLSYLDVSDNYITDISPLSEYKGSFLDISSNPLSLGLRQNYQIKSIEKFMKKNYSTNSSYAFYHRDINANDGKEYIIAKSVSCPGVSFARSEENGKIKALFSPENANTGSNVFFGSDSQLVKLEKFSGQISWDASDFEKSKIINVDIFPLSCFPEFKSSVKILAPEITEFIFDGENFRLVGNLALESVKIGNTEINEYKTEGDLHIFTVPEELTYTPSLTATAFDSLGEGNSLKVSKKSENLSSKALIFSVNSDKEQYDVGESAKISVKANRFTNFIKLKDVANNTELVSDYYKTDKDGRIFDFNVPLTAALGRSFKAYASADGNFGIGAKALSFTVTEAPRSLEIYSESGSALYFSENNDTLELKTEVFPKNSEKDAVTFSSADNDIASVDESGTLRAVNYGSTVITARTENGITAEYPIIVDAPKMTEPEVTEGYYNEGSFIEVYTKGASDIILKNADGSDVDFYYEAEAEESNIDGYDKYWVVALYTTAPEKLNLRVYAADERGINENTSFRIAEITPIIAVESFSFDEPSYSFDRNGGPVKISLNVLPEGANDYFNWVLSSNTVASIKGYSDYCILTPKNSGTLKLTASIKIGGKESTKSINVSFTEGKIHSAVLSNYSPAIYEPVDVTVVTDTTVKYLDLLDSTGSTSREYSDYPFFEDNGGVRTWTIPFYFRRQSEQLRIWGGDSIGNLSEAVYLDVNVSVPQSGFAANPCVIFAKPGESLTFNLVNLPSANNIVYSKYSVEIEDEEIASFNLGTLEVFKAGETTLHCTYNGETTDVRLICYEPIESIAFDESEITLYEGEGYILNPVITPESGEKLTFTSSDEAVATVSENGVITARQHGKATINVQSESGVSASLIVKVRSSEIMEYLSFDKESYEISIGEELNYSLLTNLENTQNKISFKTSNSNILSVSADGVFKAEKEGEVTITALSDNSLLGTSKVRVRAERFLTLNRESIELTPSKNCVLYPVIYPNGADIDGVWFTDNEAVAVISQSGVLYAKSPGKGNVYFVSDEGEIAYCSFTVNSLALAKLTPGEDEIELDVNQNFVLSYTPGTANATEKPTFKSADESICAVDENGIVYALSGGSTIVNIILSNGKSYPITVTVSEKSFTLSGEISTSCKAVLKGTSSEEELSAENSFAVNNVKEDTYSIHFSAPYHTQITISEIPVHFDLDLGSIYLPNGDLNEDGTVDISDISLILKEENFASDSSNNEFMDLDSDGVINISDISQILLEKNYAKSNCVIIY